MERSICFGWNSHFCDFVSLEIEAVLVWILIGMQVWSRGLLGDGLSEWGELICIIKMLLDHQKYTSKMMDCKNNGLPIKNPFYFVTNKNKLFVRFFFRFSFNFVPGCDETDQTL